MDPDEARKRMIELANVILALAGKPESVMAAIESMAIDLAEAVHDLDEWLRKGGYFPDVWKVAGENVGRKGDV